MKLNAKDETQYVDMYLRVLQGITGITPRERDVAVAMICKYKKLERMKDKLTTTQAKAEYDPMVELKKPEVLRKIVDDLGMSFETFRNYLSSLKAKGMFVKKRINEDWIPRGGHSIVEINYEEAVRE